MKTVIEVEKAFDIFFDGLHPVLQNVFTEDTKPLACQFYKVGYLQAWEDAQQHLKKP